MAARNSTTFIPKYQALVGTHVGRLLVLEVVSAGKHPRWRCRCDPDAGGCGREIETTGLMGENTRSCGCLRREVSAKRMTTHGAASGGQETAEFKIWLAILTRCYNENATGYENYGGRGIKVCDEWRTDFAAFLAHVGPRPTPTHSIERKDNNLGYQPGNVRWATKTEQNRNSRHNHVIEFRGEMHCISEWAEILGISYFVLRSRLRYGWSVERAFAEPVNLNKGRRKHSV